MSKMRVKHGWTAEAISGRQSSIVGPEARRVGRSWRCHHLRTLPLHTSDTFAASHDARTQRSVRWSCDSSVPITGHSKAFNGVPDIEAEPTHMRESFSGSMKTATALKANDMNTGEESALNGAKQAAWSGARRCCSGLARRRGCGEHLARHARHADSVFSVRFPVVSRSESHGVFLVVLVLWCYPPRIFPQFHATCFCSCFAACSRLLTH